MAARVEDLEAQMGGQRPVEGQQQQQQQQQQPQPQPQQQQQQQQLMQQAAPAQEVAKGPRPGGPPRLSALDAPRWIASAHVVGYHTYTSTVPYLAAGGVWTQFFFMLGGFLLSYAEMTKPPAKRSTMSVAQYVRKRLLALYPLYIFSLLLLLFSVPPRTTFEWSVLPLHLLLLQAVVPICVQYEDGRWACASWKYNSACWFLSVLLIYWLMLRPLSRFFERVSLRGCYAWLLFLWTWSLLPAAAWVAFGEASWSPIVLNMIKAGPLGFAHVFASGVVLARVFVLAALRDVSTGERPTASFGQLTLAAEGAPWLFRHGCCVGYLLWFGIAAVLVACSAGSTEGENSPMYIFFHNGGTIPMMALVLLGCAVGKDPIAKYVFSSKIFTWLAGLSYSQYLLQLPVGLFLASCMCPGNATPLRACSQELVYLAPYPFALLFAAHLAERFVGRPYAEWQRARERQGAPNVVDRLNARCAAAGAAVRSVADAAGRCCRSREEKLGCGAEACSDSDTWSSSGSTAASAECDAHSATSDQDSSRLAARS